jgi:Ulp1 family protease
LFSVQIDGKTVDIILQKDNVKKVSLCLSDAKNYIRLILTPHIAKQIGSLLPKGKNLSKLKIKVKLLKKCHILGESFFFYSKNIQHRRFILEFPELDDLSKCLIDSFFEGVPRTIEEEDVNGIFESAIESGDKNTLKKKGSDVENGENIPPASKKSRIEDTERPTRNLRSRNRQAPVIEYSPQDYLNDEEEIPEELLVTSESAVSKTPSRFDRFEHFENTISLLMYNEIQIQMEDYKCLDYRELVSNFVLDFYLQYIYNEVFTDELRRRVHIYKTHFYTLLATKATFGCWWKDDQVKGQKAAEKRYDRVKDLDSDVNIFERDFLVFPCNTNEHWFLAIACFPRLNGAVYADTGEPIVDDEERSRDMKNPTEGKAVKASCVLILDSVATNAGRKTAAMNHIKNFLFSEYQAKYSNDFPLELTNIKINAPKVST